MFNGKKGTPLINDWDVVLWQNATSLTKNLSIYFIKYNHDFE